MSKKILTIAYACAAIVFALLEVMLLIEKYPLRYYFSFRLCLVAVMLNSVILLPFYIVGIIGLIKNNKLLRSFSEGFVIWLYISLLVNCIILSLVNNLLFSGLVQVFIGGILVYHYRIPKHLFILCFLLPGLANLYFLVYGINKQLAKN